MFKTLECFLVEYSIIGVVCDCVKKNGFSGLMGQSVY